MNKLFINEFGNIIKDYSGLKNNFLTAIKYSKTKTDEYLYNGIDRKDNYKGYVIDNCLPCCTICNKSKRDLDYLIFTKWIERVSKFQMNK